MVNYIVVPIMTSSDSSTSLEQCHHHHHLNYLCIFEELYYNKLYTSQSPSFVIKKKSLNKKVYIWNVNIKLTQLKLHILKHILLCYFFFNHIDSLTYEHLYLRVYRPCQIYVIFIYTIKSKYYDWPPIVYLLHCQMASTMYIWVK